MRLWHLCSFILIAAVQQAPPAPTTVLPSRVVDWNSMEATATRTGQRRTVFDAPTDTLDKLHLHITTLNPGENTGPLHRHPQEEIVIIKEGAAAAIHPPAAVRPTTCSTARRRSRSPPTRSRSSS